MYLHRSFIPKTETDITETGTSKETNNSHEIKSDQELLEEHLINKNNYLSESFGVKTHNKAMNTMGNNLTNEKISLNSNPLKLDEEEEVVFDLKIRGNCPRPWSDHLYQKLFLDVEGRKSTLLVLKCDVTCVNVFTDVEMTLYRSRYIGGKKENLADNFIFDLMKSSWEEKIPKLQVIELTIDIVMSSSPNFNCAEALLKLIQLEKKYLKHINFNGRFKVLVRFAHSYKWESKDESDRERVYQGLRLLHREGIELEVMDKDAILEEMKLDHIVISDETKAEELIRQRLSWTPQSSSTEKKRRYRKRAKTRKGETARTYASDSSSLSTSEEEFEPLMEHDMYHLKQFIRLEKILYKTKDDF